VDKSIEQLEAELANAKAVAWFDARASVRALANVDDWAESRAVGLVWSAARAWAWLDVEARADALVRSEAEARAEVERIKAEIEALKEQDNA
jgi:hypothetical protein